MTRGRRPLVALKEAHAITMNRGQVMPVSEGRCDHFHFILFTQDRVVFVKVKRTLSNMSDPKAILDTYEREIRHLALLPLNEADAREFWVRSPRGIFHFFRIERDRIIGLQENGSLMTDAEYPFSPPKQASLSDVGEKEAPELPPDHGAGDLLPKPVPAKD